jgi:hypothetical protein
LFLVCGHAFYHVTQSTDVDALTLECVVAGVMSFINRFLL